MEYRIVAKGTKCRICGRVSKTSKVKMITKKGTNSIQLNIFICPSCVYKMGDLIIKDRDKEKNNGKSN